MYFPLARPIWLLLHDDVEGMDNINQIHLQRTYVLAFYVIKISHAVPGLTDRSSFSEEWSSTYLSCLSLMDMNGDNSLFAVFPFFHHCSSNTNIILKTINNKVYLVVPKKVTKRTSAAVRTTHQVDIGNGRMQQLLSRKLVIYSTSSTVRLLPVRRSIKRERSCSLENYNIMRRKRSSSFGCAALHTVTIRATQVLV